MNPYRASPTHGPSTGPATRLQRIRARIFVRVEDLLRWAGYHERLVQVGSASFGAGLLCVVVATCAPPRPEREYLVDCPDRDWVSPEWNSERRTVRDTEGRRVWLPSTCSVTERIVGGAP
jgi:hypothetical protein